MDILGSVSRYLRARGLLLYAGGQGLDSMASLRRKKGSPHTKYLEVLEPRVLMTTVFGGDVFQYTDASGNLITATATGNVVAELVSAVQAGGNVANNKNGIPAVGGYLLFGDIAGKFTAGPHKNVIVGNGSIPLNNGTQGNPGAAVTVGTQSYGDPNANPAIPDTINLTTLSSGADGTLYSFNVFNLDVNGTGQTALSANDTTETLWTIQLVSFANGGSTGSVIRTVTSDDPDALLPIAPGTDNTNTYTEVAITAAAVNPIDHKLYFELHYRLENTVGAAATSSGNSTNSTVTYVDNIYSLDPTLGPSATFTLVGAIDDVMTTGRNPNPPQPQMQFDAMAFVLNAANPNTASLWVMEEPNAEGIADPNRLNLAPRLVQFGVATDGSVAITSPLTTMNAFEGFGGNKTPMTGVKGLATLPGASQGGGNGFLFALRGDGTGTHITRLDLTANNGSVNGTIWGYTQDLYEATNATPVDGLGLMGLTFNPNITDPFTGSLGAFMSMDTATMTTAGRNNSPASVTSPDMVFLNHQLRVNAGDVYSVYTNIADLNSSLVFQGPTLYTGNTGVGGSPANTGAAFLGYRGQATIPEVGTDGILTGEVVLANSSPFLSGRLTNSIGIMPNLIMDTTDFSVPSLPTNKLFAGLDVARSLEESLNSSSTLTLGSMTMGSNFNHVTGLAVSPAGDIAVMNSYFYGGQSTDQLAFVNPDTGVIDTGTAGAPILNISIASGSGTNATFTPLKNVEGLAYADPNLDGTSQLYAIYDLGNGAGPTLGIIDTTQTQGNFTPIASLGLGAHGRVTSMMFTPGGTVGNPTHESLYVVADPNVLDFDGREALYQVNLTFGGGNALTGAHVLSAPTFSASGNVISTGGIGIVTDSSGNALTVTAALFDANGTPLVLDHGSGRLLDLNLNNGVAGAYFASAAGAINPSVSGVALDPLTQNFLVTDNLTGYRDVVTVIGTNSATSSAILLKLKDISIPNVGAVSLGKFLFDGAVSGKVTVTGSIDLFYCGWLITGDATNGKTWITATPNGLGGFTPTNDSASLENYFKDNFNVGGDIRNLLSLTDMGLNNGTNSTYAGLEVAAAGKIGNVHALGSVYGKIHAGNQDFIPNLIDSSSLALSTTFTAYGFTFKGNAVGPGVVTTNGTTSVSSVGLTIDSGLPNQAGSAFSNALQTIDNFTANFSFNALSTISGIDGGFAFVLQEQGAPALGAGGAGLGYSGLLNSAALEFNFDPATGGSSLGFQTNGQIGYSPLPGIDIASGDTIRVNMTYNGDILQVMVADGTTGVTYTTSFTANLPAILGSHAAYVGLTGSSGTVGNTVSFSSFNFGGYATGQMALPQEEVQSFQVGGKTFAAGYIVDTTGAAPFDNNTFAGAQFLGTVRNSASGQPDVIHLTGVLEGAAQPKNGGTGRNNTVDYFAFGVLAGQTVDVSVAPISTAVHFAIYDPDGHQIATDYNFFNSTQTEDRTIRFTADRPGAYRVAITNNSTQSNFTGGGTPGNTAYELRISGAGIGDMAIGAVEAGGNLVLRGSGWASAHATTVIVTNGSISSLITNVENSSIIADSGDIGAIQAGGTVLAPLYHSGLTLANISSTYQFSGSSSSDVKVVAGNLRSMVGNQLGQITGTPTAFLNSYPDINVSGNVGLISTSGLMAVTFGHAAGGNIQIISAGGDLESIIRTNKGIGVIRAATVGDRYIHTEFHADVDQQNNDGIIDLIDVSGDWGAVNPNGGHYPGAALVTGPSGNIRFMRVGGYLAQDYVFTNGETGANGELVHAPGPVTYIDDSGALITLTPSSFTTADTTGTVTTAGVLTTRTYGVRGAGGVVIVDVSCTTGLTISASSNGTSQSAEIGTIIDNGSGLGVTVINGIPTLNAAATTGAASTVNNVTFSSSNNMRVEAFDIQGNSIDNIVNNTLGDILNVTAGSVGTIKSNGNIGVVPKSATGTALIPLTVFSNAFPFTNEPIGIAIANAGLISAAKAIGPIDASGVIGTITANSDNIDDPAVFEGLTAPIVIRGAANATTGTLTTSTTYAMSVTRINIGEGIVPSGAINGGFLSGIYATGRIGSVAGANADIRGNIVSLDSIGDVSLTNGSIVNTQIAVYTSWNMADAFFNTAFFLPEKSTQIDAPIYVIDNINIQGNGGIIGSRIAAASINNITVGPTGFGILGASIFGVSVGTLNTITAGGWGIRQVFLNFARVNSIVASGTGTAAPIASFNARLRSSETSRIDPNTNTTPNSLTDLGVWMLGDGTSVNPADPYGLTTGLIAGTTVKGQDRMGNVSAFDVLDSSFSFPNSAGIFNIRRDVVDTRVLTGKITSITIGRNATNFDVQVAGAIGPISIGGDFVTGVNSIGSVTNVSQIQAKGFNGNITSFVNKGRFSGLLLAQGRLGSATIGVPGTKTAASSGDFSGTITIGGNNLTTPVIDLLKIYGSVIGGEISISGNATTIDIAHDFTGLTKDLVVHGNLANFFVGSDPFVNGSVMAAPITVTGNLLNAVITGAMSGSVTVLGSIGKFAVNTDSATIGTTVLSGDISAAGTLTSITVQGNTTGNIVAAILNAAAIFGNLGGHILGGRSIANAAISGSLLAGAEVTSSLGDIKSLTVKGNINGAVTTPNGVISSLSFTGNLGATGEILARNLGNVTVPGILAGTVTIATTLTALKAGTITAGAIISAANLGSLTTVADMNGALNVTATALPAKLIVGGNFGGQATVAAPLSVTINGSMVAGSSIINANTLSLLAIKGALNGRVIVDRTLSSVSAASMNGAVITAGQGLGAFKIIGAVNNSLVQAGLSRGVDNIFGTNDLGEQGRMADITSLAVGSMNSSIIAAGGNIGAFVSTGNMSSSTVSAGLVVDGTAIAAFMADGTPLASQAELNAALATHVLLHGSIKSAAVGAAGTSSTLINSFVTAGVCPGTDGSFAVASDVQINHTLTGGNSSIAAFKGVLDGSSRLLANTPTAAVIPSLTVVKYTTDAGTNSILQTDPIISAPTVVVTPTSPGTITTGAGSIIIQVSGVGGVVNVYDDPSTLDRLDTLLISSTASTPITVTVTNASTTQTFQLGRVITTDNTQLSTFTYNGDILGDVHGGPSLWIDSDMAAFTARNLPNDATWDGRIGGNVAKLTLNQLGPGKLRIGGRVTTLAINASVGNPLLQQLGLVTPATTITQIAYDSTTGNVVATDGTNLLDVNVLTGTINSSVPFHTLLTNATMSISGLSFDSLGKLFGVATLNNQNPVTRIGVISSADNLHGLAVNSHGVIYAIDSQSGTDKLVTIDPVTGAETLVGSGANAGIIRDPHTNTFSHNIVDLTFDENDNLLAITNDRDGNGGVYTTANGAAIGKITVFANGTIRMTNPTSVGDPLLITGAGTNTITGLAAGIVGTGSTIFIVQNIGGAQQLDTVSLDAAVSATAATLTTLGAINLDGGLTNTNTIGIGIDETGSVIGMNLNGSTSELIGINVAAPAASVRLDVPGLITTSLGGFAVGRSGASFTTYAYTTNATTGGTFFTSPGVVSTLGIVGSDGGFTQMLPLARNNQGASISGNVTGIAVDGGGHIFAITDQSILAEYSSVDGGIIGGQPIGIVKDAFGAVLHITRISFDSSGKLIGLNANGNNLVQIALTTSLMNGQNTALASNISELGTADASDLTALSFAAGLNKVLSYSTASGRFVNVLGTNPGSIGGIIANSFGAVTLPSAFDGHLGATGGGTTANAIDSIKFNGTGVFGGNISSDGSIGAIAGAGTTIDGAIISHADINSIALTGGSVTIGGVVNADGKLNAFSLTGNFAGHILADQGATFTFTGSLLPNSLVAVKGDLATLNISGSDAGIVSLGSNKTLKATGTLTSGGSINILGAAGAVTVSGGTQLGSRILLHQAASNITIGGTLAGVVGTRLSLASANLVNVNNGIFAVGGDLTALNVTGNLTTSVLTAGVWIGSDGIYNTADDVIYGGTIASAKFGGTVTNSVIAAGVLPGLGVDAGVNNIPTNFQVYDYNPTAVVFSNIDSAEAGGIRLSGITAVTFAKPVLSTSPNLGLFSALVAANSIGKITSPASSSFKRILRTDPPGAPKIVVTTDATTLLPVSSIIRFNPGEIRITFDQPLDTSTINASTISVIDTSTGLAVSDLSFGYFRQTADDGSIQSVVRILSASHFNGASGVKVLLAGNISAPTIADITGLRSALLDYNQDGINELDPFGTTFAGASTILGAPTNDNLANALTLSGFPVRFSGGTNINATAETSEPTHGLQSPAASVWYSWTAPATAAVTVSTDGSNFDTTLSAYQGANTYANLFSLGESDNDLAGLTSAVSFQAIAGQTYSFAVDGALGATGNIVLSITAAPPPANDNLANAQALSGLPVGIRAANLGATPEAGEPNHGGFAASESIWYTWTAPANGPIMVSTLGSGITTTLSVYTGAGTSFASLTSRAQGINTLTLTAVAGTRYTIAVDSPFGSSGNISLNIVSAVPPANDNFANAALIAGSFVSLAGDSTFATMQASEPSNIAPTATTHSVWYKWVATTTGPLSIDTLGSNFDTTLGVYSGATLTTLTKLAFNDDFSGLTSKVTLNVTSGTTYYISLSSYSTTVGGTFNLHLLASTPPANDNFANAALISGFPATVTGNSTFATKQAGEPSSLGTITIGHSVWYKWTAPISELVNFDTVGSAFDTALGVYTGTTLSTLSTISLLGGDDNSGGGTTSRLALNVIAGHTYYISVSSRTTTVGGLYLLNILPASPPVNDNFANAAVLSGFPVTVSANTTFATTEPGEPSNLGATPTGHSIWYAWTAPSTSLVTIDTIGSAIDTTVGVFTGSTLTTLSLLAADDQSGGNNTSKLTLNVVSGQLYYISVSSWEATVGGNIILNIH